MGRLDTSYLHPKEAPAEEPPKKKPVVGSALKPPPAPKPTPVITDYASI